MISLDCHSDGVWDLENVDESPFRLGLVHRCKLNSIVQIIFFFFNLIHGNINPETTMLGFCCQKNPDPCVFGRSHRS